MDGQDAFEDVNDDGSIGGYDAKFIDVNGVRTRYYEVGEENDETLLLVHGSSWAGTTCANTWTGVLEGLSDYFHVLAPDRLACGLTDNPREDSAYDWEFASEVEFIRDFVDTLGVEDLHVCGSSRGMASVSWLASQRPEQVRTVVCLNSNTIGPPVGDYGHRRSILERGAPESTDTAAAVEEMLRHKYRVWDYNPEDNMSEEFIRAQAYIMTRPKFQDALEKMTDGYHERIENEGRYDLMSGIRNGLSEGLIPQPFLLYWGRHDLTSTFEMGLQLYEMISQGNPNVRMHVVDRAGHHPHHDYPEEFVENVTTFVDHWKSNRQTMAEARPQGYIDYDYTAVMFQD